MIYLINPNEKRILENAGDRHPIGLLEIASTLKDKNHEVQIWDMNHEKPQDLYDSIKQDNPTHIGISVYTSPIVPESIDLAQDIRKISNAKLIAGGYHASALPKTLFPTFDSVVVGHGEHKFETAMRNDGIIHEETPYNEVPLDFSLLDMDKYNMQQDGKRVGTILTSRGCPFECAFCFNMDRVVKYSSPDKVKKNIQDLDDLNFERLYFLDDVFTLNPTRMKNVINKVGLPFRATTRADLVDYEKLEALAIAGCDTISLGIESGNDEILKRANKKTTVKQNENAIKLAGINGIDVKGFFIIGLPGETERTARDTIDFANRMRNYGLKSADLYFLTPFPGTPIWKNPEKFGITIRDRDYTKYLEAGKSSRCVIDTEHLKAERIEELVKEAKSEWH